MLRRTMEKIGLSYNTIMEPMSIEEKGKVVIEPDPETQNPTKKWQKMKVKQTWKSVDPVDPASGPVSEDCVRFVCISDTHAKLWKMKHQIPAGDVLLHAGDITNVGLPKDIKEFNDTLGT